MAEGKIVAAIDIGSSKVVTVVAEDGGNGEVHVLGMGVSPSRGVKRGQIIDATQASQAVHEAIESAEQSSASKITHALISVVGNHVSSQNSQGAIAIGRSEKGVTNEDIARSLESSQAIPIPSNREILHIIPRHFKVDEQSGIRNPHGMVGYRLEAQANIVTASVTALQNTIKCVQDTGIQASYEDLVLSSLASAEMVLTPIERDLGVMLVEIGSGTTQIAVFLEGALWHTSVIEVGGDLFTSDLALCMRLPLETAERLKVQYGHANPMQMPAEHQVVTISYSDGQKASLHRREIADILNARAEELFEMVVTSAKRSGVETMLPAGVVLTGGGSLMPGIREVASKIMGLPVRIGTPANIHGMVETLKSPMYSTVLGVAKWGLHDGTEGSSKPNRKRQRGGNGSSFPRIGSSGVNLGSIKDWLKNLLPG
jgi:cell division protein FtsA